MKTKMMKGLAAIAAAAALTIGVSTPAQAATTTKYGWCTDGYHSALIVKTSTASLITIYAYDYWSGKYLGARSGTGYAQFRTYYQDVKFVVSTNGRITLLDHNCPRA